VGRDEKRNQGEIKYNMTISFHSILDKMLPRPITTQDFLSGCLLMPSDYLYRGQGDHRWHLIPSAFRASSGGPLPLNERSRRVDYFKSDAFEADFRKLAASGLEREGYDLSREDGFKKLTKMMLFQHFGIPTPLLDWTESPLIALFMATAFRPKGSKRVRVFRLNPVQKPDRLIIQKYKDIGFSRINRQLGGISFIGSIVNSGKTIEILDNLPDDYLGSAIIYRNTIEFVDVGINKNEDKIIYGALSANGFTIDSMFPNSPHWAARAVAASMSW